MVTIIPPVESEKIMQHLHLHFESLKKYVESTDWHANRHRQTNAFDGLVLPPT